ncbi:MAG: hypothetical protein PHF86_04085 [Candidatus Nanoarchaeia archaeon]|jgi:hypothetical protein|nr:hypothetical protein [Candidatus Nanoarchaeia archaeon]
MSSQSSLNDFYRQPETVQLAPDALVFINGSNLLTDPSGGKFDIRQDITEINTSLSTDSVPGTASFTISYPEHRGGRYRTLTSGVSKYSNLKIMSEVEIYFRGRFLKEVNGEKKFPYYRAFWGVVTALTENYGDGVHTISVSCADILRWWQITLASINPSIMGTQTDLKAQLGQMGMNDEDIRKFLEGKTVKANGRYLTIFSNLFSGQTIPEILNALSTASMLQMAPISDYLYSKDQTVQVSGEARDSAATKEMMYYWSKRLNEVGAHLKIYALQVRPETKRMDIDVFKLLTYDDKTKNEKLQGMFGSNTIVYQSFPQAPSIAKSEKKSQLEIANELKETIHYEFFMDVNGELVFKLPFYNLDVRKNMNSIIHDLDIINWNFIQSESEVITRVDVTGTLANVSGYQEITNGTARDPYLSLQFGERMVQRSMNWLHSAEQCVFWGRAELARQNALIRQGSVTIMGRPELRLGYPVFIPSRDAFYYIKGIENRFTFGGTFTTTLTLVAERTKKQNKNSIFRNVGEIKDEQVVIVGDSIAEPNDTNNFVKQVSMPSICTPRAKEHVTIVEPIFTTDLKSKEKFGTWQTYANTSVTPNKDGEFQITDYDQYEVIGQVGAEPYITYGYGLQYDPIGTIKTPEKTDPTKDNAAKALEMNVQRMQLEVDPNNVMYTLDSENGRMIVYGTSKSIPELPANMKPNVSLENLGFTIEKE